MSFEISIQTRLELEETIEETLDVAGYSGIYSFYPVKEEFHKGNDDDFNVVMNLLTDESPVECIYEVKNLLLDAGVPQNFFQIHYRELEDTNWRDEWKKFFKPLEIGLKLLVLPEWESAGETSRAIVKIDPGMAFGVGGHGTTYTCLEFLEMVIEGGEKVLDFGSGSGILAIAAVKLGAKTVDTVEIDAVAVENANKNVVLNECDDRVAVVCGGHEVIPANSYDGILANVTADIIIENFDVITKKVTKCSWIILSGVMENRKNDVDAFLADRSIVPKEIRQRGEWFTYLLHMAKS